MKLPIDRAPKNICILRLSALGDVTHTVPVVRAILKQWPDVHLTWIIGSTEYKLLGALPGVEFIVFDKRGGRNAIRRLRKSLSGRSFDILLHMQVALRANLLSRLIRSPIRLGWDRARSRDGHHWFTNHAIPIRERQHQVDAFLEFAWALGIPEHAPDWSLPVHAEHDEWAAAQLPGTQPTLMISPCSSHPDRNWCPERYAQIGDHAVSSMNMRVALIGGPSALEQEVGQQIESLMSLPPVNLIGKDTLPQTMALLKRADVLIAPDSGPVHIASALGTPVIGLYAATWSRRSGPWNSLELCVDRFPEAARKFRGAAPEDLRWGTRIETSGVMDLIEAKDVIDQLEIWADPLTPKA